MNAFRVLNPRQQKILQVLLRRPDLQSSEIHSKLIEAAREEVSLPTVKRLLAQLRSVGAVKVFGASRSTVYCISEYGRLILPVDARAYCSTEPDYRPGLRGYNFSLLDALSFDPFTPEEQRTLDSSTAVYKEHTRNLSPTIEEKELERFIIELSWKSSKIEGNTYSLLDTEKLILRGIEAPGHDKKEARMILNHKDAFKFIRQSPGIFATLTRANMEEVHRLLMRGFEVNLGLRSKPVGVTGSTYRPLDNRHQIAEAVDLLTTAVSRMPTTYGKALLALVGISYIQPFEDGNKRTARLMANALLMANGRAPLSYRSVDEDAYREATLVFYELNSLVPFKSIFMSQYQFAAENYLLASRLAA